MCFDQMVTKTDQRLSFPMQADLGFVAIAAGIVGGCVIAQTVGEGFNQSWAVSASGPFQRLAVEPQPVLADRMAESRGTPDTVSV